MLNAQPATLVERHGLLALNAQPATLVERHGLLALNAQPATLVERHGLLAPDYQSYSHDMAHINDIYIQWQGLNEADINHTCVRGRCKHGRNESPFAMAIVFIAFSLHD